MASAYSVSSDPKEKLRKKLEQDAIRAAMGGGQPDVLRGTPPTLAQAMVPEPAARPGMAQATPERAGGRPWIPVLGPDKPMTPAATPPAGQMGPPAPDRRLQLSAQDALLGRQAVRGAYMAGKPPVSPDQQALREQRWAAGDEQFALENANRPITQPQTPTQVTEGRWGMHNQATDIVGKQRQRAMEAEKAGDYETSRRLYADADRMEGAFKRDLSPYSGPEDPQVSGIIQRQGAAVPRQESSRSAWAGEAGKLTDSNIATETRSREAMTAKMEQARLQERLGQERTKGEIAQTQYAADPETIKAIHARQTAEAITAQKRAETDQMRATGEYQVAGVKNAGDMASTWLADPRLKSATDSFRTAVSETAGTFANTDTAERAEIAAQSIIDFVHQLPPDQQVEAKRSLRLELPLSTEFGPLSTVWPGAEVRQRRRMAVAKLKQFLSEI